MVFADGPTCDSCLGDGESHRVGVRVPYGPMHERGDW